MSLKGEVSRLRLGQLARCGHEPSTSPRAMGARVQVNGRAIRMAVFIWCLAIEGVAGQNERHRETRAARDSDGQAQPGRFLRPAGSPSHVYGEWSPNSIRRQVQSVCAAEQADTELLVVPSAGKSQLVSAVSAEECCALCGRTPAYEAWSWCEPARGETMGRCTLTVLSLSPVEAEQLGQNSRLHSNERCQTGFQHLTVKGNGGEPTRVLCRRVSVVLGSIRAQKRLWWTGGGRG